MSAPYRIVARPLGRGEGRLLLGHTVQAVVYVVTSLGSVYAERKVGTALGWSLVSRSGALDRAVQAAKRKADRHALQRGQAVSVTYVPRGTP